MNLLIDMGNTRLKWASYENKQLDIGCPLLNATLNRLQLIRLWQHLATPSRLIYACVATHLVLEQVLAVAVELWPKIEIVKANAKAYEFGVTNAYSQPEKLGIDRWLALIAARHFLPLPACIVDCGTAITADLLDINGYHHGGVICPGLNLMKNALFQRTKDLPLNAEAYPLAMANNTEAGIYSGTLYAAMGLIEQVLASQKTPPHLILTGGDAEFIGKQLRIAALIDSHLVLRGLAVVSDSYSENTLA